MAWEKRYRVVQWATGTVGSRSLRNVIRHPRLDLVGLYVHDPVKVGRDAGEICGLGSVGVAATDSVEAVVALDADCVLYMQQGCNLDDICRILESGKNIVTTRVEFHHPASMDADVRKRVERACERGRTSIYSTGSSPGFITEALPFALLSVQQRLDSVVIDEFADMSVRNSPDMILNVMGFGRPSSTFDLVQMAKGKAGFAHSLRMVAEAIGAPLETVEFRGEVASAQRNLTIAAGTIEAGTVAGQRITVSGIRGGRPFLTFRANWYCTPELDADWELRETGWRVQIVGDAPLDIQIRNPVPLEELGSVAPNKTPNRAVNAVPFVCEAKPGICTTAELPHIVPYFGA